MELAALVRSVLKLSAGIQLAPRSSLGRARLPLPAGTGTHHHVHSWQASPKNLWKTSWFLNAPFNEMFSKKGREKEKKNNTEKEGENTFSCVLSQGHLGQVGKVYSICCLKHYLCMLCMMPHTFTLMLRGSQNKTTKPCHIPSVSLMWYYIC